MANLWLKFKIWTKIVLGLLAFGYLIAFVLFNHAQGAKVWVFLGHEIQTTVLVVAFVSFLLGALVAVLSSTALRTARQIRELRERNRSSRLERAVQDMHAKASMLRAKPLGANDSASAVEPMVVDEPAQAD